jgi:hypothetical protein
MATTQTRVTQTSARTAIEDTKGWLTYAGILVLIGGILDVIWGIAAIDKAHFFVANASYVISDLNTWGWITAIVGAVLIVAGMGILQGRRWAIWVGLVFVSVNAVTQMLAIPAYPWWSLAVFGLDVIAVYGLVAHGLRSAD